MDVYILLMNLPGCALYSPRKLSQAGQDRRPTSTEKQGEEVVRRAKKHAQSKAMEPAAAAWFCPRHVIETHPPFHIHLKGKK